MTTDKNKIIDVYSQIIKLNEHKTHNMFFFKLQKQSKIHLLKWIRKKSIVKKITKTMIETCRTVA